MRSTSSHFASNTRRRLSLALSAALMATLLAACGDGSAPATSNASTVAHAPATLAEARRLLDLSQLPVPQGAEVTAAATPAATGYRSAAAPEAAFAEQRTRLESSGWSLQGDAQIYPQSASGVFGKNGYVLSLTAMPDGAGATLQLIHHGNVDLSTLSPPEGVEVRFAQAISAIWETTEAPDAAAATLREALLAQGWESYGEAGPMRYSRRNAVRLSAMTNAAPDGRTMHNLGVELLPAQIPMPRGAARADFDSPAQTLRVQHAGPIGSLVDEYSSQLAGEGWKTSLDAPIEDEGKQVMTWRNADQDLLALSFAAAQPDTANVAISYQSKAQIDAMNARLDAQAEAWKKRNPQ